MLWGWAPHRWLQHSGTWSNVPNALLADVDWCMKQGFVQGESCGELRVCDRINECIAGAAMLLQPLRCVKFEHWCSGIAGLIAACNKTVDVVAVGF
jgi:hypothetical protein